MQETKGRERRREFSALMGVITGVPGDGHGEFMDDGHSHPILFQVNALRNRLFEKTDSYEARMSALRDSFDEAYILESTDYFDKRASEQERHEARMDSLVKEVVCGKASFEEDIEGEQEKVKRESERFRRCLVKAANDLVACESRSEEVSGLIAKNEDLGLALVDKRKEHERHMSEMKKAFESDCEALEVEAEAKVTELLGKKRSLVMKVEEQKGEWEPRIAEAKQQLAREIELINEGVARELEAKEDECVKTIAESRMSLNKKRTEMSARFRAMKETSMCEIEGLREELMELEGSKTNSVFVERIEVARQEAQERVEEKEEELKQMEHNLSEIVAQTEADYAVKVDALSEKLEKDLTAAEETVDEAEHSVKVLEEKLRKMAKHRVRSPLGEAAPSPRRRIPGTPSAQTSDVSSVQMRCSVAGVESQAMERELTRLKVESNRELRTEKLELKALGIALEKEKSDVQAALKALDDMRVSRAVPVDHHVSDKVRELEEKLALQDSTVQQLKSESEQYRVDPGKWKIFKAIRSRHLGELAALSDEAKSTEDSRPQRLRNERAALIEKLSQSREENGERTLEASKRVDIALSELRKVKQAAEDVHMRDFGKWRELRLEIGDAITTLSDSSSMKPRTPGPHIRERPVLPPLRED